MSFLLTSFGGVSGTDPYDGDDALEILTALGLTSGLQMCVDAGDATSYTSGQTWATLSGGLSLYRGADSSSGSDDPTFNGVAGAMSSSEYFSLDGGDTFTLNQSNTTFIESLHKHNAKFTILIILFATDNTDWRLAGTVAAVDASAGVLFQINASNKFTFSCRNNGAVRNFTSTGSLSTSTWTMLGMSYDEKTGVGHLRVANTVDTLGDTYSNPSTGSAGRTLTIGSALTAQSYAPSGTRIASVMMWDTDLSESDTSRIHGAFGGRFGW